MTTHNTTAYPKDALPQGTLLNQYVIESVLGRGAFGITYLAKDQYLDLNVAIKEFFPSGFASRDHESEVHPQTGAQGDLFHYGLNSFLAEGKTIVRFKHPNILRVLAFFEKNQTAYMVMEYEQGQDLKHYLKDKQPLSQQALLDIFSPINEGLSLIHREGYIHRDIKPDNIYIRENGTPVLLDFGAARDVFNREAQELTRILTEGYAPYEQDNPTWADQGPWTDIYALAATLYFAISRKRPVSVQERAGALMRKLPDPYVPLNAHYQTQYHASFLAAIDQGMAFKPEDRPQDILDWNAQLTQAELPSQEALEPDGDDATIIRPQVRHTQPTQSSQYSSHPSSPPPLSQDSPDPLNTSFLLNEKAAQQEQTLTTQNEQGNNKKTILISLAVLLSAMVAGGTYFYTTFIPDHPEKLTASKETEKLKEPESDEAKSKEPEPKDPENELTLVTTSPEDNHPLTSELISGSTSENDDSSEEPNPIETAEAKQEEIVRKPITISLTDSKDRKKPKYKLHDAMTFNLKTSEDAYVACYYQDTDKNTVLLHPTQFSQTNKDGFLKADTTLTLPDTSLFHLQALKKGTEKVVCYADYSSFLETLPENIRDKGMQSIEGGLKAVKQHYSESLPHISKSNIDITIR